MRFGLMPVLGIQPVGWQETLAFWTTADALDVFASCWVFDHFSARSVNARGPCFEAWTTLVAAATATKRIRVGAMVLAAGRRDPALLAHMALTLDAASGGRLDLGVGAGWAATDYTPHELSFGTAGERSAELERVCARLAVLLGADDTSRRAGGLDLEPTQRGGVPLCIGGRGERRVLRTAARWGRHWNHPGGSVDDFVRRREVLRAHCHEIGRDPADIRTSVTIPADLEQPQRTVERVMRYRGAGVDDLLLRVAPPYSADGLERLAAKLTSLR